MKNNKTESVQEYIARGGTIKKLPSGDVSKEITAKSTYVGPATLLSYEEGDLFYGEKKVRKAGKLPKPPKVNFSDLPEGLRAKLLARSTNGSEEN